MILVLASASPRRADILRQGGYSFVTRVSQADENIPAALSPAAAVRRLARRKGQAVDCGPGEVVLASDTIIVCGAKIIQKAHSEAEQEKVMRMLSGKAHHVLSGICVIDRTGKASVRCVDTRIVMKRLSEEELKSYVAGHEWDGCAGYRIEGVLGAYVKKIIGSYSGVIGLPLFETKNMLNSAGVK